MKINSSLQTNSVLNSVTVSHIHRERLDGLDITPLLRDFASRSELRRRIFGKSDLKKIAGILLFDAVMDKLFTVLETDSI
jgi:hypothetical protein